MKNKNNITRNSLLLSYISIFMIPVIVAIISVTAISRSLIKEINDSNIQTMRSVQETFDSFLTNIHSISVQIDLNEDSSLVFSNDNEPDAEAVHRALQTLRLFTVSNSFIDNLYVYNSDYDLIISDKGTYNKEYFFNIKYGENNISEKEWLSRMENTDGARFLITKIKRGQNAIGDTLEYIVPLSGGMGKNGTKYATLVIQINKNAYFSVINNLTKRHEIESFIIDQDNNIITSSEEYDLDVKYSELDKVDGHKELVTDKGKYVLSYTTSEKSDWKYVIATKKSVYFKRVNTLITVIILIGIILCALLGGSTIAYYSKTNYIKMAEVYKKIKEREVEGVKLMNALTETAQKNKLLSDSMERKNDMLKEIYMEQLLYGMADVDDSHMEYLRDLTAGEDSSYLVVLCIPREYSDLFVEETMSDEERKENALFIIANVMEELISALYKCHSVNMPDGVAIIARVPKSEKQNINAMMDVTSNELISFVKSSFDFDVIIGIGGVVEAINDIKYSYKTAVEALDYRIVSNESIYNYNLISGKKGRYIYTLETQKQLINLITAADKQGVQRTIEKIFDDNLVTGNLSVQMLRYLIVDIMGTINKVGTDIYDGEETMFSDQNVIEQALSMEKIEDTKEFIISYACAVCDFRKNDDEAENELAVNIKRYADENYCDIRINVAMIADYFHLSYPFISKTFKAYEGESLLDYIHKKKIEYAKQLLREGYNLNQICEKVGYVNSNTLIRQFKKYEGITPGQYKKHN